MSFEINFKKNIAFIPPFDYIIKVEGVSGGRVIPSRLGRGVYPAEVLSLNKK